MSNVDAVIERLGLRGVQSVATAINQVTEFLAERDLGPAANELIVQMGGTPVTTHPVDADIVLKTIVEQIVKGQFVDIKSAQFAGHQKVDQIRAKMPYLFKQVEEQPAVPGPDGKGKRSDKNASSLAFVKDMITKGERDRGVITTALAKEWDTDYAGAYFYVKKAEKALGVQLTAIRGRKSAKKKTA